MADLICPYCGAHAVLVEGHEVYPQRPDLYDKRFWACLPCEAWVGCHPNTTKPLGQLADDVLRMWRQRAHRAFDPLWKTHGWGRSSAYRWLAEMLGVPGQKCHMGTFNMGQCKAVIKACAKPPKAPKRPPPVVVYGDPDGQDSWEDDGWDFGTFHDEF